MGWGESFRELDPVGDLNDLLVETPRGASAMFLWRPETNDANLLIGISTHADEYKLRDRYIEGWALDVGAHIGGVSVQLLLDNPDLRVVAVEAVPDNVELLQQNLERNGVSDRAVVIEDAATAPGVNNVLISWGHQRWEGHDDSYVQAHRFIGNQYRDEAVPESTINVPGIWLSKILDVVGIDSVEFMKIDCEGCEWDFLDDPELYRVRTIIGEAHAGYEAPMTPPEGFVHETRWTPGHHKCGCHYDHILRLLEPTHHVEMDALSGIFEAWLR